MTVAGIRRTAITALLIAATGACGHKGNPLPPDRPTPPPVGGFAIERVGTAVTLRFDVPGPVRSDRSPRLFERVDVYALTKPAADPAPTPAELETSEHRLAAVNAPVIAKTGEAPPESGVASLVYTDTLAPGSADASAVRYYAVQAVNGKRRGPLSPIGPVPLAPAPAAPAKVVATYDARALSLSWAPGTAGQRFVVDETGADGGHPVRLTTTPLETPGFEAPVEFGKARCFVVRAIQTGATVTIVGDAAVPVCVTPVDHFPPAIPADLIALAGDTGVEVSWSASAAADLAGYIVLRAEGANGTLQPLMPTPIAATAYRDGTARSGVTYDYAVKAVDRAGNESAASNRYTVTARGAGRERARAERRER